MKLRLFLIFAALIGLVGFLSGLLYFRARSQVTKVLPQSVIEQPTPTPAPPQRAVLLFAGSDGLLHPELRRLPLPAEVDERTRTLVNALIEGPHGSLSPIFPYHAKLLSVFVDLHDRAFIDISAPETPIGGSTTECNLAYGIVDTVLLNTDLKAVQLLFDGKEVQTLGGHLDFSRPLSLNKAFIGQ